MSKQVKVYQCEQCAGLIMPTRRVLLARMKIELKSDAEEHLIISDNRYNDDDEHSFCDSICLRFFIQSRIDKIDASPSINPNTEASLETEAKIMAV